MKRLDMPALKSFVAAVKEKNLSRAADRENLVISAASKQISELEGRLDKALFVRNELRVEPTPTAILFYQHANSYCAAHD